MFCMTVQQVHAESVVSAVQRALFNHPEIRSSIATSQAARANIEFSKSLSRPTVNFSSSVGTGANRHLNTNSTSDPWAVSLSVAQPLYDGGVAKAEKRRSLSSAAAADQRLNDTMNMVGLQTVQTYIEILRLRAVHAIMFDNVAALSLMSHKMQLRVTGGFGSDADIFEARSRVDAAKFQLLDVEQQQRDAAANFQLLVGVAPTKLEPVLMLTKALPSDVEDAVALARSRSPKILALRYDALAAVADVDGSQALARPKLDFVLGLDHSSDFTNQSAATDDLSAKLSFRLALYDGGSSKARVKQARATVEANRFSAESAALDVEREIRIAWNTILSSRTKTAPLQRQYENAKKSLSINIKRFDAGLTSLEKIMDMQSQATADELALLNEQVSARYNVFRILGGTGQLITALGLSGPNVRTQE
jgi:TolC family type I secretion outer membrane protein